MSSDTKKSRFTFTQPSKAEEKRQLRKRLKEEDERAEEQGPREIKVSVSAFKRNAKKREKVILEGGPRPSAWSFDGRIEEVSLRNNYVVLRSMGGDTMKTFIIEETTQDFEKKQVISLVDLKKGMEVRVRYKWENLKMVAKWIKVR